MTWKEYLPLAEKTLSTQFHCSEEVNQKLLHAVIGALTEVEELLENYENGMLVVDTEKQGSVAEESADIFWYLSILFRELNIAEPTTTDHTFVIDQFKINSQFDILTEFTKQSLRFLDMLKKKIYYNKDMSLENMVSLTMNMFNLMNYYCEVYNTNVSDILDKNIAKLKARYGEKFSSERAINRDLETERTILEGGK
jgi:NTP pyrophosphatase (non-canonical NTP hydrolase)